MVVPRPLPRPLPPPAVLPVLPARHLPTDPDSALLDVARLDRSGRLSARGLLRAMGWASGHRMAIDVVNGAITITSSAAGRHAVDRRRTFAVPAAARHLCGIGADQAVVLAAYPSVGLIVVHPVATVVRLLTDHHQSPREVRHDR
jgi:hypothetical protein